MLLGTKENLKSPINKPKRVIYVSHLNISWNHVRIETELSSTIKENKTNSPPTARILTVRETPDRWLIRPRASGNQMAQFEFWNTRRPYWGSGEQMGQWILYQCNCIWLQSKLFNWQWIHCIHPLKNCLWQNECREQSTVWPSPTFWRKWKWYTYIWFILFAGSNRESNLSTEVYSM